MKVGAFQFRGSDNIMTITKQ